MSDTTTDDDSDVVVLDSRERKFIFPNIADEVQEDTKDHDSDEEFFRSIAADSSDIQSSPRPLDLSESSGENYAEFTEDEEDKLMELMLTPPHFPNLSSLSSEPADRHTQDENPSPLLMRLKDPDSLAEKLREARECYIRMVQKVLDDCGVSRDISSLVPPSYESFTEEQLEEELAKYGFRYTTRESAISKLVRCWNATQSQFKQQQLPPTTAVSFIRTRSKYYESILTYQPVPFGGLLHELQDARISISANKLRAILDQEGVAFLE